MFKSILIAGVASLLGLATQAQAVTYVDQQYSTSALATAQGVVDGSSAINPPSDLSILSTATAAGESDFANAAAVGSAGLLTATASADSLVGAASALASSSFVGSFAQAGAFSLMLDFNTFNSLAGGSGMGSLAVLLTNTVGATTTTLFNSVYTEAGSYLLQYSLPSGSTTQLGLFLSGNAATTGAGQTAQSFAQVGFTSAVPEPASWLLLGLGIGALVLRRQMG